MEANMNTPIKVCVGKRYIDKKNCVVTIRKVTPTGWFVSNESSYRKDGTSFHGPKCDLFKAID
jgi:hypothetical protein